MTFTATHHGDGRHIDVQVTSGPVKVVVTEQYGHLRGFWHDLGKLLDEAEQRNAAAEQLHMEDGKPAHESIGGGGSSALFSGDPHASTGT